MKTIINKIFTTLALGGAVLTLGCTSSFDKLNSNPDAPTMATPGMLATGLILEHVKSAQNGSSIFLEKRMFWGEQADNSQYNRFGNGSFSGILSLTNAQKMVDICDAVDKEAYTGLMYYFKGWAFYRATMDMGDIPYSEALQVDKIRYPKYDTQKEVFMGILSDLEQADAHFALATKNFDGDPFYKGSPAKWRKATNVLRLKVLMSLQLREPENADMKIKETFAKVVAQGNLFTSNADNLQIVYSDKDGQKNPLEETSTRSVNVYAGSKTMIDPLKQFEDYRLFYYFAPMQALTDPLYLPAGETLLSGNDWNAYTGLDVAAPFSSEQKKIAARMHSRPADIYRKSFVGVPAIRLGYADMNFVLAEAAERGWITGSAKEYYEKGIKASFDFVKNTVPNEKQYNQGMLITDEYVADYLTRKGVSYDEDAATGERLRKIWLQAYLASYIHLPYDTYYDYRRTGYPEFPINPETNLNDDKNVMPVRWLYPTSELNYNKEQMNKALENQWGGVENVNKKMWVIK